MTWRDWQPLIALVASSYRFVQVRGTWAWDPTGLIPWFSKTEGNTYATLLHRPFLFKGKPTQCSRGSKKISGAIAGEARKAALTPRQLNSFMAPLSGRSSLKSWHTKYPSQTHLPRITLFAICLSFSSPPLHPCRFIRPLFSVHLFFACFLFARVLDCLFVTIVRNMPYRQ